MVLELLLLLLLSLLPLLLFLLSLLCSAGAGTVVDAGCWILILLLFFGYLLNSQLSTSASTWNHLVHPSFIHSPNFSCSHFVLLHIGIPIPLPSLFNMISYSTINVYVNVVDNDTATTSTQCWYSTNCYGCCWSLELLVLWKLIHNGFNQG